MNDVFDDLEAQLKLAVRARRPSPRRIRSRGRRTSALVLLAMLVASAAALAAGGVIQVGAPAERQPFSYYQQQGGGLVKGTVRLLGVSAPDPAGGPAWGMRVLSTKRGEGCIQVGRLTDGKLGAVGQDDAFANDGLFHEFTPDTGGAKRACTLLDGNDRLFLNVVVGDIPASAWVGTGSNGCVPITAGHYERFDEHGKPYPVCRQADERNLYYGLLGPDGKSVTYVLDGHAHTLPTVGPEGAYMIVTPASPTQLFNFDAGGTQDVVPVDGPITELHYVNGSTCHLTSKSWIGGRDACSPELNVPVGWVAPRTPAPTAQQVASPVTVKLTHSSQNGYEASLRFISRVAITNARSSYTVSWHEAGQPAQVRSYERPSPLLATAGGLETATLRPEHGLHSGTVEGEVLFQDQTGPGNLEEAGGTVGHVVGTFKLTVP
jgi:hypothetical protein